MSEENKLDLINFLEEKEYQGIFTLKELHNVNVLYELDEYTLI